MTDSSLLNKRLSPKCMQQIYQFVKDTNRKYSGIKAMDSLLNATRKKIKKAKCSSHVSVPTAIIVERKVRQKCIYKQSLSKSLQFNRRQDKNI